jgi:hypothetical protein
MAAMVSRSTACIQRGYEMKKLIVIVAFMLNGCALYDAYMQTGFDNNEYLLITQIRVDAQTYKTQCDNLLLAPQNAFALSARTQLFEVYSEQIPRNDNGKSAAKKLNEIAQGLFLAYGKNPQPSVMYCKLKYTSIENSAAVIQHVVGDRPR